MPIKRFPEFTYLRIQHKEIVDKYLKKAQPKASELTFANMFIWRRTRPLEISMLDKMLIIREMSPLGVLSYYPPITGKDLLGNTVVFIEEALLDNERFTIDSITEPLASQLKASGYSIESDRDSWDYVYSLKELVDLKSSKYAGRTVLINKFIERMDGRYRYVPMDGEQAEICKASNEWKERQWCRGGLKPMEEPYAIIEALDNFTELGLFGGVLYVDDKLAGFTIGEIMKDDTLLVHFKKADRAYPGIHRFLNMSFASTVPDTVKWVNMEQDVGSTELKMQMLQFPPDHYIEKLTLKVGEE